MAFRIFGFALWFLSVMCVVSVVVSARWRGDVPLIGGMLDRSRPAEFFITLLIILLFSWVLIDLALKTLRVLQEYADLRAYGSQLAQPAPQLSVIGRLAPDASRTVRRAHLHLTHLSAGSQPEALHELIPGAAALDANTLASRYGALHVYAWILPVLGFIGTASGMADAIGGFRGALSQPEGFENIITKLSQNVIPGLAGAFGMTILALAASLVAYLCTTSLKGADQEALDQLDRLCFDALKTVPTVQGQMVALLTGISGQLSRFGKLPAEIESSAAMLREAAAVLVASGDRLQQATRELHEAAKRPTKITIERGDPV
jgi:biopolymer transport protein ExbB/TolQ